MAIPEKPLELDIDPNNLTLDEMAIMSPKGFDWYDFRQFLIDHVISWTPDEIGKITIGELQEVSSLLKAEVEKVAVPLANSPPSKIGRGLQRRDRPNLGTRNRICQRIRLPPTRCKKFGDRSIMGALESIQKSPGGSNNMGILAQRTN